jgi:hypothetical protein
MYLSRSPAMDGRSYLFALSLVAALFAAAAPTASAAVTARGSVEQAYVLGAKNGERLTLLDRSGRTAGSGRADRLGSKIFLDVAPGAGYAVQLGDGRRTKPFSVLRPGENPPQSFFKSPNSTRDSTT